MKSTRSEARVGTGLRRALPLAFSIWLGAFAAPAAALEPGDLAPAFDAPSLGGGGTLSLEAHRGKVVLVDFWASWCAPCRLAMPEIESLRREFADRDFQVIAINVDRDPRKALAALERTPVGYPSASDPEGRLPARFELATMPTSYVIGRDGRVHTVHEGFREGDIAPLRSAIRAALAQE